MQPRKIGIKRERTSLTFFIEIMAGGRKLKGKLWRRYSFRIEGLRRGEGLHNFWD